MIERAKVLFSKWIPGRKKRNYFIDVLRSDQTGNSYLILSGSTAFEGIWTGSQVVVFPDDFEYWRQVLDEAMRILM